MVDGRDGSEPIPDVAGLNSLPMSSESLFRRYTTCLMHMDCLEVY